VISQARVVLTILRLTWPGLNCRLTYEAHGEELLSQLPPQGQPVGELAAESVPQAPHGRRLRRVEGVGQRLQLKKMIRIGTLGTMFRCRVGF